MARSRARPLLAVVGGVYHERCAKPEWNEIFGSGGRAASSLARMTVPVELHAYADKVTRDSMGARSAFEKFQFRPTSIDRSVSFDYLHGLDTPRISDYAKAAPIELTAPCVVRFGMLEGDAIVRAKRAVYDPQNPSLPKFFTDNGSEASSLAFVLNMGEAARLTGLSGAPASELAKAIRAREKADAIVIKMGAAGAFVSEGKKTATIPPYLSDRVWKIGTGDAFVAAFAHRWLVEGENAFDSADLASRATAYYCGTRTFPSNAELASFDPKPFKPSARFKRGRQPSVYLAGPFFTLANLWIIQEARTALMSLGLKVFSPYHDVGHGSADDVVSKDLDAIQSADLIFAVADGLDSGTIYEIGYARSRNKPVVVYCENEPAEALKMMVGSDCTMCTDFVSAIYKSLWISAAL